MSDGLIADKRTNYGMERSMSSFGYVTLGSTESEDGRTRTESGFQGKLTRVQMWQKALDVTSQIPRQVINYDFYFIKKLHNTGGVLNRDFFSSDYGRDLKTKLTY